MSSDPSEGIENLSLEHKGTYGSTEIKRCARHRKKNSAVRCPLDSLLAELGTNYKAEQCEHAVAAHAKG